MNRNDQIKMMVQVREAVYQLIQESFDLMDKTLEANTFKKDDKKLIRAPRARLELKNLRLEILKNIKDIGKEYEGDSNE